MTSALPYAEVIGDPIAHSKSPMIHRLWLARSGLAADYRATRVSPGDLGDYVAKRRSDPLFLGCNVTMPLKQLVIDHLNGVHPAAAEIGAVNLVRRGSDGKLHGRNSDVEGIWRALDVMPAGKTRAILLGTGGAARAAAYALRRIGFTALHVVARNPIAAELLAKDLFPAATVGEWNSLPEADLLVNATPLGMEGKPWPGLPLDRLARDATVFDMVYAPARTPLLVEAERQGLQAIGGASMLLHQAAAGFATLFGAAPPRDTYAELTGLISQ